MVELLLLQRSECRMRKRPAPGSIVETRDVSLQRSDDRILFRHPTHAGFGRKK